MSHPTYTPEDVITRVIDAEFGEASEWAGDDNRALCPDCCRTMAVTIREALASEGFIIMRDLTTLPTEEI
jgi:hypothetical protein